MIPRCALLCLLLGFSATATAQYWEQSDISPGPPPGWTFTDYDSDGDADLISLTDSPVVYLNRLPDPWLVHDTNLPFKNEYYQGQFVDMDGDGDQDMVFNASSLFIYDHIGWAERLGPDIWDPNLTRAFDFATNDEDVRAGDTNGDGFMEMIASMSPSSANGLTCWTFQPPYNWSPYMIWTYNSVGLSSVEDIDGDGYADFAAGLESNGDNAGFYALFGQADGTFDSVQLIAATVNNASDLILVDFDDDSDLDIVGRTGGEAGGLPATSWWWENMGDRVFEEHVIQTLAGDDQHRPLAVLDLEMDGDLDVVLGRHTLLNSGDDFSFIEGGVWTNVTGHDNLVALDIDLDGDLDLVNQMVDWYANPSLDPPPFIVRLVPRQHVIPPGGGELIYDGMAYSQLNQTRTLDVWATVRGPEGNVFDWWEREQTFQPGNWYVFEDVTHQVPGGLPQGVYTLKVTAGILGVAEAPGDSLQFTKN